MTTIGLIANDQLLVINSKPKLSSGDQNTVKVHVDFSEDWDGFGKSAVFCTSNDTNTVYEKVLTNGESIVPAEVMVKRGVLYIGVRGVNSENNEIKTTTLVTYKILEGAPSGTGTEVVPTLDIYQQLLSAYGKNEDALSILDAKLNGGVSANAIREQNKSADLKFWVGTKEEYNALETKPENTFCIITDETRDSMFQTLTQLSQRVGKIGTILWSGSMKMGETDFIGINNLKNQSFGIALVFSPYINGAAVNTGYNTVIVPVGLIPDDSYIQVPCFLNYGNLDHIGIKTLRVYKDRISGLSDNVGTRKATSGIIYDNDYFVLRYVIGL